MNIICVISLLIYLFFGSTHAYADDIWSIVFTGDIMLSRGIERTMKKDGPRAPFKDTRSVISSADIAVGNLESPLSFRGAPTREKYIFRADPGAVDGLRYAGFDILTLANNHSFDYGVPALYDTLVHLHTNGILTAGAVTREKQGWEEVAFQIKNTKVAFLAYDRTYPVQCPRNRPLAGICPAEEDIIVDDIKRIRKSVDLIFVSFHWGNEYHHYPSEQQKRLAHLTIDAGADIIIGHHPHVLQGVEFYKGKPIFYSLGNFLFDQRKEETFKSIMVNCTFRKKTLQDIRCIPINRTATQYYPVITQNAEKNKIISFFKTLSYPLNNPPQTVDTLTFDTLPLIQSLTESARSHIHDTESHDHENSQIR